MTEPPPLFRFCPGRRWVGMAGIVLTATLGAQDGMNSGDVRPRSTELAPVFFPPIPPPLGRLVSRLSPPAVGRFTPHPDLGPYINEPFYAPLSTRLARENLTDKLREKLAAYHAAKTALQAELHAELDRVRAAEPAARRTALDALARRQTTRIAELEQTAEELRGELITGDSDWSAHREWHLGHTSRSDRGDSPSEVAQVMRAAAYYQAGLLPAQRRLLREISLEVAMSAEDEAKAAAAQPFLFFPPEPARVILPDDLPADLAAQVGEFQTKKSALKKELFDLVYAEDSATFAFARTSKFRSLASAQSARLASLERLAEQIRAGLGQISGLMPAPLRSPLPVQLTQRTIDLINHQAAYQNETRNKLDEIGTSLRSVAAALSYQLDGEIIRTAVVPRRSPRPRTAEDNARLAALRAKVTAIEEEYKARHEAFLAETNELRNDVAQALSTSDPNAVNKAFNEVARYAVQRENDAGYNDYGLAVYEPGLSPEQRRLLFDGAIEKLGLPLPRGELQPTRRSLAW